MTYFTLIVAIPTKNLNISNFKVFSKKYKNEGQEHVIIK